MATEAHRPYPNKITLPDITRRDKKRLKQILTGFQDRSLELRPAPLPVIGSIYERRKTPYRRNGI